MNILLISTYELGHQPFGLASPAAWLSRERFAVQSADSSLAPVAEEQIRWADVIAFYLPMHTATRMALQQVPGVRRINPQAKLGFYGLYASMNARTLNALNADFIIGGEFETGLVEWCQHYRDGTAPNAPSTRSDVHRQQFILPDRSQLPGPGAYVRMRDAQGVLRKTGYTEATRGCRHLCRHCPIVPVYNGRFRVVQGEVVLSDIRQQVAAGAEHIIFGDPDFLNGPGHVLPIVAAMHHEFPDLTYDVIIKVEHLLKHRRHLSELRDTGCIMITSAVESVDDDVLNILDKGHTRADFITAVALLREIGISLNATFVTFTPWTTLAGYRDMLTLLAEQRLVQHISPIQLAIRLLIPAGSKLLELEDVRALSGPFDEQRLVYPWEHPDGRMDKLQAELIARIEKYPEASRSDIFRHAWDLVNRFSDENRPYPQLPAPHDRTSVPYLNEPWYC